MALTFGDYQLRIRDDADAFELLHGPSQEVLLTTQHISLDTFLRVAVVDHSIRDGISLDLIRRNLGGR
jgi:hypothetical protein